MAGLASKSSSQEAKDLMADLNNHLKRVTAVREYPKSGYSPNKFSEELKEGERLISALSVELGK